MSKQLYLTGCNNYETHDEAKRAYHRCETPVALELCRDGSATLNFLSELPVDGPNQPAYVGTRPLYNPAATALRYVERT